jgi:hypothetical protein
MSATIVVTRLPAGTTQKAELEKLFASPSYLFFKEMVVSRCVLHQVDSMNAGLYPENEDAAAKCDVEKKKAAIMKALLDVLDDLEKKEDEWFTVKLETTNQ